MKAIKNSKQYCDACAKKQKREQVKSAAKRNYTGVYKPTADGRVFK